MGITKDLYSFLTAEVKRLLDIWELRQTCTEIHEHIAIVGGSDVVVVVVATVAHVVQLLLLLLSIACPALSARVSVILSAARCSLIMTCGI